jgi:hypothetical protein
MALNRLIVAVAVAAALVLGLPAPDVHAAKPTIMKGCKNCHKAKPDVVRGKLVSHSPKFQSLQVTVGRVVWIVKYDEAMKLEGAESLDKVKKGKEMSVTFKGDEDSPMATLVSIKKPFKLPEEQLVSAEEMKALVRKGPKEGGYLLVDSRPPAAYDSGHLPHAVSIPYPKLNKMREKVLPAEKDKQIIFYCGGFA